MAATTDLLTKVGLPGSATTLDSPGFTIGNTTINVGNTANWQTETKQVFAMDQVTIESGKEVRVAGSYRELEGIVTSATSIGSMSFASGFSPRNYPAGSTTRVYIPVSSTRENQLVDWGKQDHNLKGNHKTLTDDNGNEFLERGSVASAVNHVKVTNAITGGAPSVEGTGDDANVPLNLKSKGTSLVQINGYEIDASNSFQNSIINGACTIAQRSAPNLSSSYQYGAVDRFAAKATGTAVSAGTISQTTAPNVTALGYALKLAGVTVTGSGIVYIRYRVEAKDSLRYKNSAASFSVKVYQDTGSSINATIYVNKANAADDFSATTAIANSGAIAIPTSTVTTIKFENMNSGSLGDVTNGIEIEIQISCGAVTTKNFELCEFQLNKGSKALPFFPRGVADDLAACQRYYEVCSAYLKFDLSGGGTATMGTWHPFATHKRVAPTLTLSSLSQTNYQNSSANSPGISGFAFTGEILNGATIIGRQSTGIVAANAEL